MNPFPKKALIFTAFLAALALFPVVSEAGFGITPPYVKNQNLTRASAYEQEIIIVRSDPTNDLRAEISFDVPEANSWFTIDRGREFILPKGEQQVRMKVRVLVPEDAEFGAYKGNIRIRTSPADGSRTGTGAVSIALGAQIDVDIAVIDKKIYDFRVRKIQIADLAEGYRSWWLDFPGKIRFTMTIESSGNVPTAPKKVAFSLYNAQGETLLERTENINKLEKVAPFETKDVVAEIPTWLPAGSYLARYQIFGHEGEVEQEGELTVSVLPRDKFPSDAGFGFVGLSLGDKLSVIAPIVVLCALIARALIAPRLRRRRG